MPLASTPKLAFGNADCIRFRDPEQMSAELAPNNRAVLSYRPIRGAGTFYSKMSLVKTPSLRMVASVSSPVEVIAEATSPLGVILLPFLGNTTTRYGNIPIEWGDRGPVFLPPDACKATTSARSVVSIDVDPVVMEQIAMVMFPDLQNKKFSLERDPKLIANSGGKPADVVRLLKSYAFSIDLLRSDSAMIERSGLDEAILRAALMILRPDLLWQDTKKPTAASAMDLACDYIDANLTSRITLTDLERICGISARSLQYLFKAKFNETPIQWVTKRRLEAVRRKLLMSTEDVTVTSVASQYFTNLGDFAAQYKKKYGEKPSDTLRNF